MNLALAELVKWFATMLLPIMIFGLWRLMWLGLDKTQYSAKYEELLPLEEKGYEGCTDAEQARFRKLRGY